MLLTYPYSLKLDYGAAKLVALYLHCATVKASQANWPLGLGSEDPREDEVSGTIIFRNQLLSFFIFIF